MHCSRLGNAELELPFAEAFDGSDNGGVFRVHGDSVQGATEMLWRAQSLKERGARV